MQEKRRRLLLTLLLFGFMLPALTGCYTPAGRTAGEVIDDSTITTMVKAKLFDAEELNGFAISVSTFEGTVTLTGAVDTAEQKMLAGSIARSVREVRRVNNLLVNK